MNRDQHVRQLHDALKPNGKPVPAVGRKQLSLIRQLGYIEEWQDCHDKSFSEGEAIDAFLDIVQGCNAVSPLLDVDDVIAASLSLCR